MRTCFVATMLAAAGAFSLFSTSQPVGGSAPAGHPLVIELDNAFIKKYAERATITSVFTISGMSAPHPAKNDGEVHIGGWSHEAGLAGVSEVMNVATTGKKAMTAFRQAVGSTVTVTGAWRLWGEHAGTGPQLQQAPGPNGAFNPEIKSNPEHVFEIHPVTSAKIGDTIVDATAAIGETKDFPPHDANQAFVLGYERLPCTISEKNGRTKIITESLGFNFTEFVIRLDKDVKTMEDGGHAVRCSVFDTDGELLVRDRRMIFIKGTSADDELQGLAQGRALQVIGIPRIDLTLVQWRLAHQNGKDDNGKEFDVNPLKWRLPYEMIIVAAKPFGGHLD